MRRTRTAWQALIGLGLTLGALAAAGPVAAAPVTQTPIKTPTPPIHDDAVAVSASFFAWSQDSAARRAPVVLVQAMASNLPTGKVSRVSLPGGSAIAGGIAGTRLAYFQFVSHRGFDIRFYNLALHKHSNPPVGVNTSQSEGDPTLTSTWLMFDRTGGGTSRVLLFNLHTRSVRVLARVSSATSFALAGQVNGNFAAYQTCVPSTCHVFVYDITTRVTTAISHPSGLIDVAPAVSSAGTLYWEREDGSVCGRSGSVMMRPPGGPASSLGSFPNGTDFFGLQTYNDGSHDQLFYVRESCTADTRGIYRITAP